MKGWARMTGRGWEGVELGEVRLRSREIGLIGSDKERIDEVK